MKRTNKGFTSAKLGGRWKLRLLGTFELCSPEGKVVKLPTRKTEALLAMLALTHPQGMNRVELGQSLWADRGLGNRQINVRQCLAKLRAALGAEAIAAGREHCRLSETFPFDCDAWEVQPRGSLAGPLLPDFSEAWFAEKRRSFESPDAEPTEGATEVAVMPLEGFTHLLRWYAAQDPARAMDLLRANRDLALGLHPKDLKDIADKAEPRLRPGELAYGWLSYWKGNLVLTTEDLETARPHLQKAISFGHDHADLDLEIEAGFLLGMLSIVLGHLDHAQKVVDRCRLLGTRTNDPVLLARIDCLAGSILVHRGLTQEGLIVLEKAGRGFENNLIEHAQNDALRALYHATIGEVDLADGLLMIPEKLADETRHFRLDMICGLVRGLITLKVGELSTATKLLDRMVARSADTNSLHFEIYSREMLAVAAWKLKDREETTDQLRASDRLRRTLKMAYTGWDQLRLSDLRKDR